MLNLTWTMVFGTEHEEFIALDELTDLLIDCFFGPLSVLGAQPAGGPPASVHIEGNQGSNFVAVDGTYNPSTRDITADGIGTVAGFEDVTVELEMHISETGEVTGTYTMGAEGELPGGNPGVYEIAGQVDLPTPAATATDTPEPSVTSTATPAATPTPTGGAGQLLAWGNIDCDQDGITTRDNQALLRKVLSQPALSQTEPCPDPGAVVGVVPAGGQQLAWGNLDCDEDGITTRDNQALFRKVLSQAALSQTEPCPDIGTDVLVTEG